MFAKRLLLVLLVASTLLSAGAVVAQSIGPQALPGSGWLTGQQIQNVGTGDAIIQATAYDTDDTSASGMYPVDETKVVGGLTNVPSGESRNILDSMWSGAPASFQGAAVVSADQPIVAIVNVAKAGDLAAAQYQGVGSPSTEIGFPLWKYHFGKDSSSWKETTFYIQNAGSSSAVINATFKADDGTEYTWDSGTAVEPGWMVVLSPADARDGSNNAPPEKTKGGLVVTCTEPIAGVVLEHGYSDSSILQAAKGFSPSEYSDTLVAPIIKRQFGGKARSTGLQVQNVSDTAVDITVTYVEAGISASPGTTYVQVANNVQPGASFTFFENAKDSGDNIPTGVLASATIEAVEHGTSTPANIAAIVNETFYPVANPGGVNLTQTTYGAIPVSLATQEVGIPLVKEVFGATGKRNSTGIQVMNVGAAAATVEVAYSFGGTTYTLQNVTIDPGASETMYRVSGSVPTGASWAGGNALPSGQFGAATVTGDSGDLIVAIVQETSLDNHQDNKNYEGFNLSPSP